MTDEEKAEEYSKGKAHEHYHFLFEENAGSPIDFAKLCYLDGLAEGKPKWHDLRKDPNDLPKLADKRFPWSITVANQDGEACEYNYRLSRWQNCLSSEIDEPIAWCELPMFEEN